MDVLQAYEIILIAIGLSMDAFAISITLGLSVNSSKKIEFFIPGLYFGFFQALMPLIGYFTGALFTDKIQQYDHWIAFILLGSIGGKMIIESFSKDKEKPKKDPFHPGKMLVLAIATSIDALMIGVTFAFFQINLILAVAIIGCTTFFLSTAGVKIGQLFGERFKSKAELIGGVVLLLLGMKILMG